MIATQEQLRSRYAAAGERSLKKEMPALDAHCIRFIGLSPFLVLASGSAQGAAMLDASPRGGAPGFVRVKDANTILLPDAPGNNRLDTFTNIIASGKVGLLFLLPGVDETLRINGTARLRDEAAFLDLFKEEKHPPKLVIEITVREAYLHCAKALMRSKLWDGSRQIARSEFPSMGQMLRDQIGGNIAAETQEEMIARYQKDL